jgi:5-methylcytosine-specific restriction endonuclease McrA
MAKDRRATRKTAYKRDYDKEYKRDHSSKKDKEDRAARNLAHNQEDPPPGYEVDHKEPLSKGGSNGKSNRRVVKRKTNRTKGARSAALTKRLKLPMLG